MIPSDHHFDAPLDSATKPRYSVITVTILVLLVIMAIYSFFFTASSEGIASPFQPAAPELSGGDQYFDNP